MKRTCGLLLVVAVIGSTSGCSIVDRLFLANFDGPYAHHAHGGCRDGACQDGACQDGACQDGACQDGACRGPACENGACATGPCPAGLCKGGPHCRHHDRYGGLAKHHLTPEEEAALAASNYGQTGPAGPPTGAVAYPYYTTRGPRDFLAKNPPSIGP
jgi:hypothetical protein